VHDCGYAHVCVHSSVRLCICACAHAPRAPVDKVAQVLEQLGVGARLWGVVGDGWRGAGAVGSMEGGRVEGVEGSGGDQQLAPKHRPRLINSSSPQKAPTTAGKTPKKYKNPRNRQTCSAPKPTNSHPKNRQKPPQNLQVAPLEVGVLVLGAVGQQVVAPPHPAPKRLQRPPKRRCVKLKK
jgi:hypothetical protein